MSRYLIIGGAGRTGRLIGDRLASAGQTVVTASRNPGTASHATLGFDLSQPDTGVLAGFDGVAIVVEPPSDAAGADAVAHHGVAAVAATAATLGARLVLVSQIYITRAAEHPEMRPIIEARGRGEEAVRRSGVSYAIVRPAWLTDSPSRGAVLAQGDDRDGQVSRDTVASAVLACLRDRQIDRVTFEVYDGGATAEPRDWSTALHALEQDT